MAEPARSSRPPAPRRSARAERTRSAILAAAEAVFAESGFAATRLEDVAERVGIRRASIVYHFRDKAELYDAVLGEVFGGLLARLEPCLLGPGSLAERAEASVSAWIDYVAARPTLARLLLREVADAGPQREPALLAHTGAFFELVERALARDPADRPPVDPVQLASTVAGSTVFFVAGLPTLLPDLRLAPPSSERIEAHRAEMLGLTRRLLGAAAPGEGA